MQQVPTFQIEITIETLTFSNQIMWQVSLSFMILGELVRVHWWQLIFWNIMSTIEERTAYLDNPYFTKHIYGDFTTFYVVITICAIFGVFLAAVNIICGCCSKHRQYWQDRHTGEWFLITLFSKGVSTLLYWMSLI